MADGGGNPNDGDGQGQARSTPVTGIRPPQAFVMDSNVTENWKLFKQKWRNYSIITNLSRQTEQYQVALLLHTLGDDALRAYNGFSFVTTDENRTVDEILVKFDTFAIGKVNETYERFVFNKRDQKEGESFEAFHAAIRTLIKTCNFCEDCIDSILRDRIVIGIRDADTQTTLLKERKLTLKQTVDLCKAAENASYQGRALRPEAVHKLSSTKPKSSKGKPPGHTHGKGRPYVPPRDPRDTGPRECKYCGRIHMTKKELCPAWGKTCTSCKRDNHFAVKCTEKRFRRVHLVDEVEEGSDEEWINAVHTKGSTQLKCRMLVEGKEVIFQVDTGATLNLLPVKDVDNFNAAIAPTTRTLQMWNNSTEIPLGVSRISLRNPKNNKKYCVEFVIVKENRTPLIGYKAAEQMGLICVNDHNIDRIAAVKPVSIVDSYSDVFDKDLGSLPGIVRLKTKDDIQPVVMPDRRTPISIRPKLKEELDRLEQLDVISKVEEPTPWVSQVVTVHKKSGDLRICIDPRELNKALVRERFTLPILEDKLHELGQSRVFSKADLASGYWHVRLDHESSLLTTFQTCHGRYRWCRLPFGTSVSAEIFQRKLLEALEGLPGIVCIADDVIIHGRDMAEHDHHLSGFLQRCKEKGIKLNRDKLELRLSEVTFIGHRITQDGLQSDPEKVKAINEMPVPQNLQDLRQFLGCVNYLAKFLPHLSVVLQPLLILTRKEVPWNWSENQQAAFEKAKSLVTAAPVLSFYDPGKELVLENDASEYGIGSALFQDGKPIAFASRTLTGAETRYAQIEKEMLAVCYGLTKFHQYTFGRDVNVITDHKPLVSIVLKPLSKAPRRLQNLLLRTQEYTYSLSHRAGTAIPVADALSRAPLPGKNSGEMVHNVFYTPIKTERLAEIRAATQVDDTMTTLKNVIMSGWPTSRVDVPPAAIPYFNYRDELTVQDGIILRGERVVIPTSLRPDIKQKVHAGHLGINSCLRRARELVFWPGMSSDIRQTIENCSTCAMFSDKQPPEPLIINNIPSRPYETIATDLFSIEGRDYLVTVDCFSTFIEVDYMTTTIQIRSSVTTVRNTLPRSSESLHPNTESVIKPLVLEIANRMAQQKQPSKQLKG